MTEIAYKGGMQSTITSTAAFSNYLFIGFDGALAGTEGEAARGISLEASTATGQSRTIGTVGEFPIYTGSDVATSNLAVGSPVTTDATGKAILANADTDYVLGRALNASTAADELIVICLNAEGRIASS